MSDAFLGEIRLFAGNYAPRDWAFCDGTALPINGNEALFSLIGNTYGGTAGQTFGLPDLRGRAVVGQGQGSGLTPRVTGQTMGSETTTLTADNTPSHAHSFTASALQATDAEPGDTLNNNDRTYGVFVKAGAITGLYSTSTAAATMVQLNALTVSSTGTPPPPAHANMMPSLPLNYIICMSGLYPTRY
ncbi:phage tail protein [Pseudomonas sichuanensis]|uniref:phage tail protein n=1 Tax=Pseudomonas TaxID=286 RepID=UPI00382FDF79